MDQVFLYKLLKYFHIVFFTTWMAGLFYLPRIFVYHSSAKKDSKEYTTFLIMERKLISYIMNPSLVLTWVFGLSLTLNINEHGALWLNLKFLCVLLMSVFHIYCIRVKKNFEMKTNNKKSNYFRIINEIPTILFLIIIFLVVFIPFV